MDALEALGDDGFEPENGGAFGGPLTGGSHTVAFAANESVRPLPTLSQYGPPTRFQRRLPKANSYHKQRSRMLPWLLELTIR